MFYSRAALVGCLGLFAMSGCGWQDYEDFDYNGVHSDDGIGFATIKRYYEGRDEVTHIARRNNSTQLYTGELSDLDGAKALTGVLNGEAIAVYYMRSAGYSILIRAEEEVSSADEKTRLMYVDTIDMSGNVTNIITQTVRTMVSCDGGQSYTGLGDPLELIPSPSGDTLAKLDLVQECGPGSLELTFLDANTFSVVDGPFEVDVPTSPFAGPVGPSFFGAQGWSDTQDETFMIGFEVGSPSGLDGWSYTVGDGAAVAFTGVSFECLEPATTSSEWSEGGELLDVDSATGVPNYTNGNGSASFGCP